ncbi:unnamed protein product [Cylindrotheca closterium]|uniref:Kinesin light chain n=1 Tax=Cylindrotheca closterium TaxID=2856 RepID=A0AAD2FPH9_9STRA|nr:unnamed protein product [Cylindrotheca closterium]
MLADQNRFDDALQMLDKSIQVCYRLKGQGPCIKGILAQSLDTKAGLLQLQGKFEDATEILYKVVGIQKESLGEMHPATAEAYETLANAYVLQEMLQDGIAASAEALKIRRRTIGDDHPDTKRRMEAHRSLLNRLLENRG